MVQITTVYSVACIETTVHYTCLKVLSALCFIGFRKAFGTHCLTHKKTGTFSPWHKYFKMDKIIAHWWEIHSCYIWYNISLTPSNISGVAELNLWRLGHCFASSNTWPMTVVKFNATWVTGLLSREMMLPTWKLLSLILSKPMRLFNMLKCLKDVSSSTRKTAFTSICVGVCLWTLDTHLNNRHKQIRKHKN